MKFLATIYTDETTYSAASEENAAKEMAAYEAFGRDAAAAGVLLGGEALHPTGTGKTIRMEGDKRIVVDGPFAETKEQLGGYYVLQCKDLDEAVEWAARIPGVRHGSVEVRQIMEFEVSGDSIASASSPATA